MNAVAIESPAFGACVKALNKSEDYREGFVAWLMDNFHVWRRFEQEALRVWNRGRRHYSARTIIEVLRHESALSDTGVEYKLNDHNTPDLARLFLDLHPACAGLFETRRR
jgi:hypothetical protein